MATLNKCKKCCVLSIWYNLLATYFLDNWDLPVFWIYFSKLFNIECDSDDKLIHHGRFLKIDKSSNNHILDLHNLRNIYETLQLTFF